MRVKDGTSQPRENCPDRGDSKYTGAGKKELRTFEDQKGSGYSWSTVNKWSEMRGRGWQRADHAEFL